MNKFIAGELTQVETMTSREIAEVTGKRHDAVLRDIRNLVSQLTEGDAHNYVEVEYTDTKGERRPMFQLTKKGCLCLLPAIALTCVLLLSTDGKSWS